MDLDKLILGGHSFGGMTAMQYARKDPRIKALFTLDPWLYPRKAEIEKGEFKIDLP